MNAIQHQRPPAVHVGGGCPLHNKHQQHDLPLSVLGRVSSGQNGQRNASEPVQLRSCDSAEHRSHVGCLTCDSDQEVVVFDNSPAGSGVCDFRNERIDDVWGAERADVQRHARLQHQSLHTEGIGSTMAKPHLHQPHSHSTPAQQAAHPNRQHSQYKSQSATTTPLKATALGSQGLSLLNPHCQHSPALSCASMPSPHHTYAAMSAADSTCSFSTQSVSSCNGLALPLVVKKYKRAKSLLQAHLHEVQRLKGVAAAEEQKAAAAAEQARTLEGQLAASTAAVVEARVAQHDLQQQLDKLQASACNKDHQQSSTKQMEQLNNQVKELLQQNLQLQLQSELSCKQLALQQQLSTELTHQLEGAEAQLRHAQEQQLALLAELQQQQLQLELQAAAADTSARSAQDTAADQVLQLRDQLLVADLAAADKDKLIRELTLQWREAVHHVEELKQQIKQQDGHHQRLLRASGDSLAEQHALIMHQLQQRLQQAEAVMQEMDEASAAAVMASEQQQCLLQGSVTEQQQQHQQCVTQLEQQIRELQDQLQQVQQQGQLQLKQQQQHLAAKCVQLLSAHSAAQTAAESAQQLQQQMQDCHQLVLEAQAAALHEQMERQQQLHSQQSTTQQQLQQQQHDVELQERLCQQQEQLAAQQQHFEAELAAQQQQLGEQLSLQQQEHDARLAAQQQAHDAQLEAQQQQLTTEYQQRLHVQQIDYEAQLSQQKEMYDAELKSIQQSFRDLQSSLDEGVKGQIGQLRKQFKADLAAQQQELQRQHQGALAAQLKDFEQKCAAQEQLHAAQLKAQHAEQRLSHAAELAAQRVASDTELESQHQQQAEEVKRFRQQHAAELTAQQQAHATNFEALRQGHEAELQQLRQLYEQQAQRSVSNPPSTDSAAAAAAALQRAAGADQQVELLMLQNHLQQQQQQKEEDECRAPTLAPANVEVSQQRATAAERQVTDLQQQLAAAQHAKEQQQQNLGLIQAEVTRLHQELTTAQHSYQSQKQQQQQISMQLSSALSGLEHQLVLSDAKARLLEPLASRRQFQVQQLQQQWSSTQEQVRSTQQQLAAAAEGRDQAAAKAAALTSQLSKLQLQRQQQIRVVQGLQRELAAAQIEKHALQQQIEDSRALDRPAVQSRISSSGALEQQQQQLLKLQLQQLQQQVQQMEQHMHDAQMSSVASGKALADCQQQLQQAADRFAALQQQLERTRSDLDSSRSQISQLEMKLAAREAEVVGLQLQIAQQSKQLEQQQQVAEMEITGLKSQLQPSRQQLTDAAAQQQQQELQQQLAQLQQEHQQVLDERDRSVELLLQLQDEAQKLQQELQLLRAEYQIQQEMQELQQDVLQLAAEDPNGDVGVQDTMQQQQIGHKSSTLLLLEPLQHQHMAASQERLQSDQLTLLPQPAEAQQQQQQQQDSIYSQLQPSPPQLVAASQRHQRSDRATALPQPAEGHQQQQQQDSIYRQPELQQQQQQLMAASQRHQQSYQATVPPQPWHAQQQQQQSIWSPPQQQQQVHLSVPDGRGSLQALQSPGQGLSMQGHAVLHSHEQEYAPTWQIAQSPLRATNCVERHSPTCCPSHSSTQQQQQQQQWLAMHNAAQQQSPMQMQHEQPLQPPGQPLVGQTSFVPLQQTHPSVVQEAQVQQHMPVAMHTTNAQLQAAMQDTMQQLGQGQQQLVTWHDTQQHIQQQQQQPIAQSPAQQQQQQHAGQPVQSPEQIIQQALDEYQAKSVQVWQTVRRADASLNSWQQQQPDQDFKILDQTSRSLLDRSNERQRQMESMFEDGGLHRGSRQQQQRSLDWQQQQNGWQQVHQHQNADLTSHVPVRASVDQWEVRPRPRYPCAEVHQGSQSCIALKTYMVQPDALGADAAAGLGSFSDLHDLHLKPEQQGQQQQQQGQHRSKPEQQGQQQQWQIGDVGGARRARRRLYDGNEWPEDVELQVEDCQVHSGDHHSGQQQQQQQCEDHRSLLEDQIANLQHHLQHDLQHDRQHDRQRGRQHDWQHDWQPDLQPDLQPDRQHMQLTQSSPASAGPRSRTVSVARQSLPSLVVAPAMEAHVAPQPAAAAAFSSRKQVAAATAAAVGYQTDGCLVQSPSVAAEMQQQQQQRGVGFSSDRRAGGANDQQQQQHEQISEETLDQHDGLQAALRSLPAAAAASCNASVGTETDLDGTTADDLSAAAAATARPAPNNPSSIPAPVADILKKLQQQYQCCQAVETQLLEHQDSLLQQQLSSGSLSRSPSSAAAAAGRDLVQTAMTWGSCVSSHAGLLAHTEILDRSMVDALADGLAASTSPTPAAAAADALSPTDRGILAHYQAAVQQALGEVGRLQQLLLNSSNSTSHPDSQADQSLAAAAAGSSVAEVATPGSSDLDARSSPSFGSSGQQAGEDWQQQQQLTADDATSQPPVGVTKVTKMTQAPDRSSVSVTHTGGDVILLSPDSRKGHRSNSPVIWDTPSKQQQQHNSDQPAAAATGEAAAAGVQPGTPWKADVCGQLAVLQQQLLGTQARLKGIEAAAVAAAAPAAATGKDRVHEPSETAQQRCALAQQSKQTARQGDSAAAAAAAVKSAHGAHADRPSFKAVCAAAAAAGPSNSEQVVTAGAVSAVQHEPVIDVSDETAAGANDASSAWPARCQLWQQQQQQTEERVSQQPTHDHHEEKYSRELGSTQQSKQQQSKHPPANAANASTDVTEQQQPQPPASNVSASDSHPGQQQQRKQQHQRTSDSIASGNSVTLARMSVAQPAKLALKKVSVMRQSAANSSIAGSSVLSRSKRQQRSVAAAATLGVRGYAARHGLRQSVEGSTPALIKSQQQQQQQQQQAATVAQACCSDARQKCGCAMDNSHSSSSGRSSLISRVETWLDEPPLMCIAADPDLAPGTTATQTLDWVLDQAADQPDQQVTLSHNLQQQQQQWQQQGCDTTTARHSSSSRSPGHSFNVIHAQTRGAASRSHQQQQQQHKQMAKSPMRHSNPLLAAAAAAANTKTELTPGTGLTSWAKSLRSSGPAAAAAARRSSNMGGAQTRLSQKTRSPAAAAASGPVSARSSWGGSMRRSLQAEAGPVQLQQQPEHHLNAMLGVGGCASRQQAIACSSGDRIPPAVARIRSPGSIVSKAFGLQHESSSSIARPAVPVTRYSDLFDSVDYSQSPAAAAAADSIRNLGSYDSMQNAVGAHALHRRQQRQQQQQSTAAARVSNSGLWGLHSDSRLSQPLGRVQDSDYVERSTASRHYTTHAPQQQRQQQQHLQRVSFAGSSGSSSDGEQCDSHRHQVTSWSGPGPLLSSSARQAALQQLKAYQNTWKWSRG